MVNKTKGLIASLALATATAFGADTTNLVKFTSAPYQSASNIVLRGIIGGQNTRTYRVQTCTNLAEGVWADSVINTAIGSKAGRNTEFYIQQPKNPLASQEFYRLVANDVEPTGLSINKSYAINKR